MKVFMTGGTGFVGTTLARELTAKGHSVTVLVRKGEPARDLPAGARALQGDPTVRGAWQEQVPGHEVFINLAGASIFTRWTGEAKRIIRESFRRHFAAGGPPVDFVVLPRRERP